MDPEESRRFLEMVRLLVLEQDLDSSELRFGDERLTGLGLYVDEDLIDHELSLNRVAVEVPRDYHRRRGYIDYLVAEVEAAVGERELPRLLQAVDTARRALR